MKSLFKLFLALILGTALAVAYLLSQRSPLGKSTGNGPLALVLTKKSSLNWQTMKLDCAITNISTEPVDFWMWNCAYDQHFRVTSSDSSIREIGMSECSRNFIERFSLSPGESKTVSFTVYRVPQFAHFFPKLRVIFHPAHPEHHNERVQPPIEEQKEAWKHDPVNQDFTSDEISF